MSKNNGTVHTNGSGYNKVSASKLPKGQAGDILRPISHSDFQDEPTCARTGKKGAKKWSDTSLVLTPEAHDKFRRELDQLEKSFTGSELIRKGAELIIQGLKQDCGVETDNENFADTPNRVARLYMELFGSTKYAKEEIDDILSKSFPGNYEEMILVKNASAKSMCPHHLLIVDYNVSLGYIPAKGGNVLGLSKLSRLAQLVAAKPALQEETTFEIVDILEKKLKPKGVICFIEGKHSCVSARGVKDANAVTVTSAVRGIFRDVREKSREEFFAAIQK